MKLHAQQLGWLLLIVFCALHATKAATKNDVWTRCIRNILRSFTQPQQNLLCASIHSNGQDPTAPGRCAKIALGGRPLQPAKFASRGELLRAASIIQLCSKAQNMGPANCWIAIPAQVRQQMLVAFASTNTDVDLDSEAAVIPLVRVCKHAQDDRPAQCLLLWLEMSKTLSRRDASDALDGAVTLCKSFDGQTSALKQCMMQVTPHLRIEAGSQFHILQLCQFIGDGENLAAVIRCASKLGRKHILPNIISQVCAGISDVTQPQTCFVEAQQKLRWMSQEAQISLCMGAAERAPLVPVYCALEMKNIARTLPFSDHGKFVANLCHGATNATTVIQCVKLVPAHTFTASHTLRLCAASAMPPPQMLENDDPVSLYPTRCATRAQLLLQRSLRISVDDLGMSVPAAAVHVCEQATSDAPSKCLADTQRDRALSVKLRVQLCQRATSDSPQRCVCSLRKFINAGRMDIYNAVMTCRQTESIGPVECVGELFHTTASVTGKVAAQLCHAAKDSEPAHCFAASPAFYDDELKVLLCNQAESSAPASCVNTVITRFANQPLVKVSLCRGATTAAPAACAIEAPFGMDETNVVELCRSAQSSTPAKCAQELPRSLGVPWLMVAQVCTGATSTTPGRCLAHHVRHSRMHLRALDENQVVAECRLGVVRPAALGIAKASYSCPELHPLCPLHIVVDVLDQYGHPLVDSHHQVVYVNARFTESYDQQHQYFHRRQPVLQGPSYAKIVDGSADFSNLLFTGVGTFTLTFHAGEGVTEEVARVVVHPDLIAEALQTRCEQLFIRFQCSAESPPSPIRDKQRNEIQMLLLPRELHLNAVTCGEYWMNNIGGLAFSGFSAPSHVLYVLPRPLYDLFTYVAHLILSAFLPPYHPLWLLCQKHGHPTSRHERLGAVRTERRRIQPHCYPPRLSSTIIGVASRQVARTGDCVASSMAAGVRWSVRFDHTGVRPAHFEQQSLNNNFNTKRSDLG
ncbi:hypothetical protein L914_20967 [Phytophthora nicotianae]|uniref:Uncharacterized protein n=1 Tax=Phytophthora nicotianae TaxID=4792 RepID=W2M5A1_PHYNI|nr:hypothetical protein L914_20967 [Phytophthora nicotianae]